MKTVLFFSLLAVSSVAVAQPKLVNQAVISTTTNVIAPEEDELTNVQNGPGNGGGGMAMFRNFGDGETKSTTYLKNNMVKTVMKSDMGRSTILRDNDKKLTTTLIEMMGNKTGFYITDAEQAEMRKRMDSMMQARRATDSAQTRRSTPAANNTEVVYTEQAKKIAGYNCKKAYVVTTRFLGKDSMAVWYTPDIKLNNISSTGGMSGFGNMGGATGLDKIDGFVMQYEMNMPRGRKMTVEVTKVDTGKEVADKEFEIPKDFEVKPMKEMQNMMGGGRGGMQIIRN
ncbi:MAG: hypothetical protein JWQ27_600 [Ferruginibacter sp.]|nr:hypothetical protein [Ferruginibacter sp.]